MKYDEHYVLVDIEIRGWDFYRFSVSILNILVLTLLVPFIVFLLMKIFNYYYKIFEMTVMYKHLYWYLDLTINIYIHLLTMHIYICIHVYLYKCNQTFSYVYKGYTHAHFNWDFTTFSHINWLHVVFYMAILQFTQPFSK